MQKANSGVHSRLGPAKEAKDHHDEGGAEEKGKSMNGSRGATE